MSLPWARLMAASTRSLGMLTLLAFSMQRRRAGLVAGSGPPALTAMAISFPIRENCFAIRSQRANIVDFLTSKMRPIIISLLGGEVNYWAAKVLNKKNRSKSGAVNAMGFQRDGYADA